MSIQTDNPQAYDETLPGDVIPGPGYHIPQKRWRSRKLPPRTLRRASDLTIERITLVVAMREILTGLPEGDFMSLDVYFPIANKREAARVLSELTGEKVTRRQYERCLEQARRKVIQFFAGLDHPYTGELGPWPDGRQRQWREDCDRIAEVFDEVREKRAA
jgi:hypothetical protein